MNSIMGKFRIERIPKTAHYRVFLNDEDISSITKKINIVFEVDNIGAVHLVIVPREIELPPDLELLITAEKES